MAVIADIPEASTKIFVKKLTDLGPDRFLEFLCTYGNNQLQSKESKGQSPEIELMNYSDRFLSLYRKDKLEVYSEISFLFKRAAHRIYHLLLKQSKTRRSKRFLNVIQGK